MCIKRMIPKGDQDEGEGGAAVATPTMEERAKGPNLTAIEAYRAAIRAGRDGRAEMTAAWRIEAERLRDVRTFQSRAAAASTLRETIPALEKRAAERQRAADLARRLAGAPLSDFGSLDEMCQVMAGAIEGALHMPQELIIVTLHDLARAITIFLTEVPRRTRQAAHEAAEGVRATRAAAMATLASTVALETKARLDGLRGRLLALEKAIEQRTAFIEGIDGRVARCRERCERLAKGERIDSGHLPREATVTLGSAPWAPPTIAGEPSPQTLYRAERERLATLLAELGRKSQAIRDNEAAAAEIGRLRAEIQRITETELTDPRNMRFCGE